MQSSDEDFELFLQEFLDLLNKYHYNINHKLQFGKFAHEDSEIVAFQSDGTGVWMIAKVGENFFRLTGENSGK